MASVPTWEALITEIHVAGSKRGGVWDSVTTLIAALKETLHTSCFEASRASDTSLRLVAAYTATTVSTERAHFLEALHKEYTAYCKRFLSAEHECKALGYLEGYLEVYRSDRAGIAVPEAWEGGPDLPDDVTGLPDAVFRVVADRRTTGTGRYLLLRQLLEFAHTSGKLPDGGLTEFILTAQTLRYKRMSYSLYAALAARDRKLAVPLSREMHQLHNKLKTGIEANFSEADRKAMAEEEKEVQYVKGLKDPVEAVVRETLEFYRTQDTSTYPRVFAEIHTKLLKVFLVEAGGGGGGEEEKRAALLEAAAALEAVTVGDLITRGETKHPVGGFWDILSGVSDATTAVWNHGLRAPINLVVGVVKGCKQLGLCARRAAGRTNTRTVIGDALWWSFVVGVVSYFAIQTNAVLDVQNRHLQELGGTNASLSLASVVNTQIWPSASDALILKPVLWALESSMFSSALPVILAGIFPDNPALLFVPWAVEHAGTALGDTDLTERVFNYLDNLEGDENHVVLSFARKNGLISSTVLDADTMFGDYFEHGDMPSLGQSTRRIRNIVSVTYSLIMPSSLLVDRIFYRIPGAESSSYGFMLRTVVNTILSGAYHVVMWREVWNALMGTENPSRDTTMVNEFRKLRNVVDALALIRGFLQQMGASPIRTQLERRLQAVMTVVVQDRFNAVIAATGIGRIRLWIEERRQGFIAQTPLLTDGSVGEGGSPIVERKDPSLGEPSRVVVSTNPIARGGGGGGKKESTPETAYVGIFENLFDDDDKDPPGPAGGPVPVAAAAPDPAPAGDPVAPAAPEPAPAGDPVAPAAPEPAPDPLPGVARETRKRKLSDAYDLFGDPITRRFVIETRKQKRIRLAMKAAEKKKEVDADGDVEMG